MPGLINAQAQQAPQQQPAQPQAQQPQQEPSPQNLEATKRKMFQMKKIVLAAQKVLYGDKTRARFLKMMKGDDLVQIASNITTTIMLILISESRMKINPELIIPAGVIVIGDILDFVEKAKGAKHTEVQVEDSIEAFVKQIMSAVQKPQQSPGQQPPEQPPTQPAMQPEGVM